MHAQDEEFPWPKSGETVFRSDHAFVLLGSVRAVHPHADRGIAEIWSRKQAANYSDSGCIPHAGPPNNKTNNVQGHPGISMAAWALRILSDKAFPGSSWT